MLINNLNTGNRSFPFIYLLSGISSFVLSLKGNSRNCCQNWICKSNHCKYHRITIRFELREINSKSIPIKKIKTQIFISKTLSFEYYMSIGNRGYIVEEILASFENINHLIYIIYSCTFGDVCQFLSLTYVVIVDDAAVDRILSFPRESLLE